MSVQRVQNLHQGGSFAAVILSWGLLLQAEQIKHGNHRRKTTELSPPYMGGGELRLRNSPKTGKTANFGYSVQPQPPLVQANHTA